MCIMATGYRRAEARKTGKARRGGALEGEIRTFEEYPEAVRILQERFWGLSSMEERVSLLGGFFELVPEAGGGARAEVSLPLMREKDQ